MIGIKRLVNRVKIRKNPFYLVCFRATLRLSLLSKKGSMSQLYNILSKLLTEMLSFAVMCPEVPTRHGGLNLLRMWVRTWTLLDFNHWWHCGSCFPLAVVGLRLVPWDTPNFRTIPEVLVLPVKGLRGFCN